MHLVFLNQYYPPDLAPTGTMLKDLAERLVEDGHEVTILCGSGGYTASGGSRYEGEVFGEEGGGVRVERVRATRFGRGTHVARVADYAGYYLAVAWRLMWMRSEPDRIVALTTPPFLSVLARLMSKLRGGDHAHWVMDLYPDVLVSHGMIQADGLMAGILRAMARWGFGGKRCGAVLSLGPDMARRVGEYLEAGKESLLVPLWATAVETVSERERLEWRGARGWGERELVVLYSGNMGLGHRFAEFLGAAEQLAEEVSDAGKDVRFVFTGGGKRKGEIEAFVAKYPDGLVDVGDYVPFEDLAVHLASADLHLVSLEPVWDGVMVPSKLQGIFAMGGPVLFVGSPTCSIGEWVSESEGGWVVQPGDVDGVVSAIREAAQPGEGSRRGANAREFAGANFSRETNTRRLSVVFGEGSIGPP
ncbi:MAG: glycosyltransferase family 4 protein [Verrucomicrobiota bacterium]